jgi:Dyp-type peroxidase family
MEFSRPGQPLVWPGQVVCGYPSTHPESGAAGGPLPPVDLPAWLNNGSLLVFRRLRQRVAEFRSFLQDAAAALSLSAFPGMTPERLGALLVGRWSSGAPLLRAPAADVPAMAADSLAANDFLFVADTPPPRFIAGVRPPAPFPAAVGDFVGLTCPRAAHIRKINPRDHDSNLGDPFDTLRRRVIRRGIPYGPSLPPGSADDGVDRGLHFLCYQTSIEEQFEVLQSGWANSVFNPSPRGHDMLIGQTETGSREIELLAPDGAAHIVTAPMEWVVTTGGGYFFAPSVSAIRDVLGDANRDGDPLSL